MPPHSATRMLPHNATRMPPHSPSTWFHRFGPAVMGPPGSQLALDSCHARSSGSGHAASPIIKQPNAPQPPPDILNASGVMPREGLGGGHGDPTHTSHAASRTGGPDHTAGQYMLTAFRTVCSSYRFAKVESTILPAYFFASDFGSIHGIEDTRTSASQQGNHVPSDLSATRKTVPPTFEAIFSSTI